MDEKRVVYWLGALIVILILAVIGYFVYLYFENSSSGSILSNHSVFEVNKSSTEHVVKKKVVNHTNPVNNTVITLNVTNATNLTANITNNPVNRIPLPPPLPPI